MRRGNLQSKATGHAFRGRVAGAYVQGSPEPKGVRALRFAEVSNTRLQPGRLGATFRASPSQKEEGLHGYQTMRQMR